MRRGFSLLELIVAVTLLALVLTVTFSFLLPVTRASVRTSLRTEETQQAVVALNRLIYDAQHTAPPGFSLRSTAPVAVGICPLDHVQPDGTGVWLDHFVVYSFDAASGELIRRIWPPGGPTPTALETSTENARHLSPDRLQQIVAAPPVPAQQPVVLAHGVQAFNIIYPPGGSDTFLVQPVQFQVVLQRAGNTGQVVDQIHTYTRSVFVRNQGT